MISHSSNQGKSQSENVNQMNETEQRLSRALDAACDYIRNIEGPPPGGAETWRDWWLKLIDENQDQQG